MGADSYRSSSRSSYIATISSLMRSYNFALVETRLPPSTGTTVPVTHSPPLPDNQRQAAATSSGFPILFMGKEEAICCSAASSVALIILDRKGPRARVLHVITGPSCDARCRDILRSMCANSKIKIPRTGAKRL